MLGVARAWAIAPSTSVGVTVAPCARATMQPFCAPPLRRWRVSRRVSMPAMPTVLSRAQVVAERRAAAKVRLRAGTSLTTSPAAKTCADSTSSALVP